MPSRPTLPSFDDLIKSIEKTPNNNPYLQTTLQHSDPQHSPSIATTNTTTTVVTNTQVRSVSTDPPPHIPTSFNPSFTCGRPRSATAPSISRHNAEIFHPQSYGGGGGGHSHSLPSVPVHPHAPGSFEHYCDRVKQLRASRDCWHEDVLPSFAQFPRPVHDRTHSTDSLPSRFTSPPRSSYEGTPTNSPDLSSNSCPSPTSVNTPTTPRHSITYFDPRIATASPYLTGNKISSSSSFSSGGGRKPDIVIHTRDNVKSSIPREIQVPTLPITMRESKVRCRNAC